MKCLKYQVNVSSDAFGAIHNNYYLINEIFCPEVNIAFNNRGYVFELKEHRAQSDIEHIEIENRIIERFLEQFRIEKFNKEVIESFFKKEN